jgi:Uma2 family endonuclease
MSTVLIPSYTSRAAEERFVLRGLSWESYEQLLSDFLDRSSPRFTYDRGELEIMSPSFDHEELGRIITQLFYILAEEWGFEYRDFGSATFKQRETESGFEPDSCFYIQSVETIAGIASFDPAVHPPPDVILEIDLTSSSLRKFPIYARMNVPEVWRYKGKLEIFLLRTGEYLESETSAAIPGLSSSDVSDLVERSGTMKRSEWIRHVREWARQKERDSKGDRARPRNGLEGR